MSPCSPAQNQCLPPPGPMPLTCSDISLNPLTISSQYLISLLLFKARLLKRTVMSHWSPLPHGPLAPGPTPGGFPSPAVLVKVIPSTLSKPMSIFCLHPTPLYMKGFLSRLPRHKISWSSFYLRPLTHSQLWRGLSSSTPPLASPPRYSDPSSPQSIHSPSMIWSPLPLMVAKTFISRMATGTGH